MATYMTKKEYDAWRSSHAGKNQFEIFHNENGAAVVDFSFWAASRDAALDELNMFKQKQQLVSPSEQVEYFYREVNNHVVQQDNGTYKICSNLHDMLFDEDTCENGLIEKIKTFFTRVAWKMRDIKYMLYDVAFWLGHYDMKTNHGEERADCWNLDSTVTRKILFNVPRMVKTLHGCPSIYAAKAVSESRGIALEQAYRISANTEEMDKAMAMWKSDLELLVLYVRLYEYYSCHGIVGKEDGPEMAEIDEKYRNTIPVMPGTYMETDYVKCEELAQKYWNLYCDHWKKIGRMCWD
jgi:hypothetical protein